MTTNDGGPAFPQQPPQANPGEFVSGYVSTGLSLRDYFAAHASEEDVRHYENTGRLEGESLRRVEVVTRTQARYMHADAMLKERGE